MTELSSSINKGVVLHILDKLEDAVALLKKRTSMIHSGDDFACSPAGMEKLDAACMLLIAIGESIKSLDKITHGVMLPTYPAIPWKQVMGMRDIIAHHYFDVDADTIFQVIRDDLDPLIDAIQHFKKTIDNS